MIKFSKDSVVLKVNRNAKKYNLADQNKVAVIEKKKHLLDLNRSQIRIGIDSEGQNFGDYDDSYAEFKKSLNSYNAKPPRPDLFLSGSLQNKMELKVTGKDVIIASTDSMADEKTQGRFRDAFGVNKNIMPFSRQLVTIAFNSNTHKALFDE